MQIPAISTREMMEVDRLMIDEYGIQLIQMMENAGRNLAELARRMLGGSVYKKRMAILCGAGNNGGGGLAAARHLHNWGADIEVKLVAPEEKIKNIPAHQWDILKRIGIMNRVTLELSIADLIIDAMVGYGLEGDPRGEIEEWIWRANDSTQPVLALDVPSGLNSTTGIPGNPCIRAATTMTLALPKTGLLAAEAKPYVGNLYLADIGVPRELYTLLGVEVPAIFTHDSVVNIEDNLLKR